MGRPKGSKNKATVEREAEVSAPPAGSGHNSGLTDVERRARTIRALADLERKDAEIAALQAEKKPIKASLKSLGFSADQVAFGLRIRKAEDDDAETKRFAGFIEIARFSNHPLGHQFDLVEMIDRTPATEKAYDEGFIAGSRGDDRRPPYDAAGPQSQEWLRGYGVAQEALAAGIRKLEPEASQIVEAELADVGADIGEAAAREDEERFEAPWSEGAWAEGDSAEEVEPVEA